MAFIDEFSKLVIQNGQQEKIVDKDKAIIELAIAIIDGGDNPTAAELSFKEIVGNNFQTIQPDEYGTYELNLNDLNNTSTFYVKSTGGISIEIPKLGGLQILHNENCWYNYNVRVHINGEFDYTITLNSIFDSSQIAHIHVVKI